jgi:hypothetical protein
MALSTILIGRCYRRAPAFPCRDPGRHDLQEQGPQCRQGAQLGHRLRHAAHSSAGRTVEHPGRDLLRSDDAFAGQAAAQDRSGRPGDHLMDAYGPPGPWMPGVHDLTIVEDRGTVGVLP